MGVGAMKELEVKNNPIDRKATGALARTMLRAEMKETGEISVASDAFRAAWAERRDEMLKKATALQQGLRRQGFVVSEVASDPTSDGYSDSTDETAKALSPAEG